MGEYATRTSDGAHIKIGTCENMYYLRLHQIDQVTDVPFDLRMDGLRFRLPFADEEGMEPGDIGDHPFNRGARLCREVDGVTEDFIDHDLCAGVVQIVHAPTGLLINAPCHHGAKLPDLGPARVSWSGLHYGLELASLKRHHGDIVPIVRCRHCDEHWRYTWAEIHDYVPEPLRVHIIMDMTFEATTRRSTTNA